MNVVERPIRLPQPAYVPARDRYQGAANVPMIEPSALGRTEPTALVDDLDFLIESEQILLTRIRARTNMRMLALVSRAVAASRAASADHSSLHHHDTALLVEAAAIYRNVDLAVSAGMPPGYAFFPHFADVLAFVLERTHWSIAALTCHTLATMRAFALPHDTTFDRHATVERRIRQGSELVLNESANALRRASAALPGDEGHAAVDDLIVLLQGIDALLLFQADADARYLMTSRSRSFEQTQLQSITDAVLEAYRAVHIYAALKTGPFAQLLRSNVTPDDLHRLRVELGVAQARPSATTS